MNIDLEPCAGRAALPIFDGRGAAAANLSARRRRCAGLFAVLHFHELHDFA